MRKILCSALAAVTISASAYAQVSSIQSATPLPKTSADPTKLICEAFETTGTRLGRRTVCKTALEWRELTAAHREGVEQLQRMGTSVGCQEGQSCTGFGHVPH